MQPSSRLPLLRHRLRRLHQASERDRSGRSTVSPWTFLALPIHERLILMARFDGATAYQVQRELGFAYADTSLSTDRMKLALHRLRESLHTPFLMLDDLPIILGDRIWSNNNGELVERRWRQLLYPEVAMSCFGESVPPAMRDLTLLQRTVLYCVLYEEMEWVEVQALLHCTEHCIRQSLRRMMETMDSATPPVQTPR